MATEAQPLDLTQARPVGTKAAEEASSGKELPGASSSDDPDPDPDPNPASPESTEGQGKPAQEPAKPAEPAKPVEAEKPIVYDPDQIPDDVFQTLLEKKTGGKIKNTADLEDRLNNYFKPANSRLAKANEYAEKNGGDELEFYKSQSTDWTKVDPKDLVFQKTKSEYPEGVTDEQIQLLLDEKYKLDEDPDSAEFKKGQAALLKDANTVRQERIAEQQSAMIPPQARKEAEASIAREQAVKEWEGRVDKGLSSFKGITIDLGNGDTFQHQPKDEGSLKSTLQQLKLALNDVNNVGTLTMMNSERYSGQDGVQKLAEDIYFLNNRDSILQELVNAKKDSKLNDFVDKNLKGVEKKTSSTPDPSRSETMEQAVRRQIRERERGY
jgi:hypothetical protein